MEYAKRKADLGNDIICTEDLLPISVPIGINSKIFTEIGARSGAAIMIKTSKDDPGVRLAIGNKKEEDGRKNMEIFDGQKTFDKNSVIHEIIDRKTQRNEIYTLQEQEELKKEINLIFEQMKDYVPLYELWTKQKTFQQNLLGFFNKNNQREAVGEILGIPKNENGAVIVNLRINGQEIKMSKPSGQENWKQFEVKTPTENGIKAAEILSKNMDGVRASVTDYIDKIAEMKPYNREILKAVEKITQEKESKEIKISGGR